MHITKSKKMVEKGDILYDFHYIEFCKRQKYWDRDISVVARDKRWWNRLTAKGRGEFSG